MAYLYVDTDGSGSTTPFGSWATAAQNIETALNDAACVAGSTIFIQGAAADTVATARTFLGAGTTANPVQIIGVVDGTTNTGASIVVGDLASTLPVITNSGAANDFLMNGSIVFKHVRLAAADQYTFNSTIKIIKLVNCELELTDRFTVYGTGDADMIIFENVEVDCVATTGNIRVGGNFLWHGGSLTTTALPTELIDNNSIGQIDIIGVDLTNLTSDITTTAGNACKIRLVNCKLPATYETYASGTPAPIGSVEIIASNNVTSVGNTSSIQDYTFVTGSGSVDNETTVVRTGGATDGATGTFSYAMTPWVNETAEGTKSLVSPWLSVWVPGGASKTLKVFTVHDNADSSSADLNEDDLWCEFFTPDDADTSLHDYTIVPANNRLLTSSTATGTDDTASTWATHNTYKRSFDITTTPGFEGWAYARVHFAKRYAATPVTVYVDPLIEVT